MIDNRNKTGTEAAEVSLNEVRALVRLVIWAALIAVGGWISIPIPVVPISLQTFFVLLAGLVEGPRRGALAAGLYLLAGFLGLPVFTGGLGGPAILLRPSAGFALAFPLLALVAGLARVRSGGSLARAFLFSAAGTLVMYFFAWLGLMINAQLAPPLAAKMLLTFVPGDLAKCAAAASLASSRLFGRERS